MTAVTKASAMNDEPLLEKPATIPQAVKALRALLPADQLAVIKRSSADDLIRFHFNLGQYIRNLWVHREGSPLTKRIRDLGGHVADGDEVSRLVLEALWHDLNGTPFDVAQSSHFQLLLPNKEAAPELAAALLNA